MPVLVRIGNCRFFRHLAMLMVDIGPWNPPPTSNRGSRHSQDDGEAARAP